MTNTELEILRNIAISPKLAMLDKQLMKGRWDKIWHKLLPESFGIEIEIPEECLKDFQPKGSVIKDFNVRVFSKIKEKTLKNILRYSKSKILKDRKAKVLLSDQYSNLGMDIGDFEFRSLFTKYNLKGIEQSMIELSKIFEIDNNTILNLHIHFPKRKDSFSFEEKEELIKKWEGSNVLQNCKKREAIENIINTLMFKWRPNRVKKTNYFTILNACNYLKPRRRVEIGTITDDELPIRYNHGFNTIEFRGMNTRLSYQDLMIKVIGCAIIDKYLFSTTDYSIEELKNLENMIY